MNNIPIRFRWVSKKKIFGKSLDECSICLNRMYRIVFYGKTIGINTHTLECGHSFHLSCISNILVSRIKTTCPICQLYTFSPIEKKLLKYTKTLSEEDKNYLSSLHHDRAMILLKESIKLKNNNLTTEIADRFDPTEVLHYYIERKDINAILQLMYSKSLNWHRTFQGKTLIEAALNSNDQSIIQLMLSGGIFNFFARTPNRITM